MIKRKIKMPEAMVKKQPLESVERNPIKEVILKKFDTMKTSVWNTEHNIHEAGTLRIVIEMLATSIEGIHRIQNDRINKLKNIAKEIEEDLNEPDMHHSIDVRYLDRLLKAIGEM